MGGEHLIENSNRLKTVDEIVLNRCMSGLVTTELKGTKNIYVTNKLKGTYVSGTTNKVIYNVVDAVIKVRKEGKQYKRGNRVKKSRHENKEGLYLVL